MFKIIHHSFIVLLLVSSIGLSGKSLGLAISYHQFVSKQQPYLEVFFALNSGSLHYTLRQNQYQGGITVHLSLHQQDSTLAGNSFQIVSPLYPDTLQAPEILMHQERYYLAPGRYLLRMQIEDNNSNAAPYQLQDSIHIRYDSSTATAGDIQLLSRYQPAQSVNAFTKYGVEMLPRINQGTPFLASDESQLNFYLELYNLQKTAGPEADLLLRHYLSRENEEEPLAAFSGFAKKKAKPLLHLLSGYKIDKLPTGNYHLHVVVYDKEMRELLHQRLFFYRKNEQARAALPTVAADDIPGEAVAAMMLNNFDSLYTYLEYLYPISNDAERRYQQKLLAQADIAEMRRYFYGFWLNQNDKNPVGAWRQYHQQVNIVNHNFSSRLQPGYLSERGRVFLLYGPPSQRVERNMEPGVPPYELWQYNQVRSRYTIAQSNRIFVFAEYAGSTNDYQLIHSNAYGELSNPRWRNELLKFGNGTMPRDVDDLGVGSGSPYGSRMDNNIIFGSDGSGNMR